MRAVDTLNYEHCPHISGEEYRRLLEQGVRLTESVHDTKKAERIVKMHIAYMNARNKMTRDTWKKEIKPVLKELQVNLSNLVRGQTESTWQATRLAATLADIDKYIAETDAKFAEKIEKNIADVSVLSFEHVDKMLDFSGYKTPFKQIITEEFVKTVVPMSEVFVTKYTGALLNSVRSTLVMGVTQGSSPIKVAKQIQDLTNSRYWEAERIARTEMLRSASMATNLRGEQAAEENPDMRKGWLSSHKPDKREGHLEAEQTYKNQPIKMKDYFSVRPNKKGKYEKMLHPHDPSASAANVVNCACTVLYF